jgi:polyisoprenoid-binding protein YceI
MYRLSYVLTALVLSVAPAAAQTWQIDTAHSRAQFTVRHLLISDIRGDFGAVSGTVDYDGKDLTKAKINATIDVKSISTRVDKRDVANHPTMTFVSKSITPGANGRYSMTGDLTIRGTTKTVTFELTPPLGPIATRGQTKIGASASGKINRKDFGVKYHEVMDNGGLAVADDVFIQLDVELIQRVPRTSSN